MCECPVVTTLDVAKITGRLISIKPALPLIMLLVRPLYNDLTKALTSSGAIESASQMPNLERERDAEDNYCWVVKEMRISMDSIKSLVLLREHRGQLNGLSLERSLPSILIRTDASEDGGGITIWKINEAGRVAFGGRFRETLTGDQRLLSSTEREAIILNAGFEQAPSEGWLEHATVEGVIDNSAIAMRHARGSSKEIIQRALFNIAQITVKCKATWLGMWWARRYLMTTEDEISKELQSEIVIKASWFKKNSINNSSVQPSIDLFASPDNAVVDRYASMQVESSTGEVYLDGLRFRIRRSDIPLDLPANTVNH